MIAKKCDRCGKLYEEYNLSNNSKKINGMMLLNISSNQHYYGHSLKDLCPSCSAELVKWLNNESEE